LDERLLKKNKHQSRNRDIKRKLPLLPFSLRSRTDVAMESGRELYGLLFSAALRWFIRLLDRWIFFRLFMPCESLGHVSLSELSLSDAASFMKQICKFMPENVVKG
jgi:hypothetical protein